VCLAATYHVSSSSGSDSNPGTVGLPFRTIQRAVNVASAGDTILVGPGTYHEAVVINTPNLTIQGLDSTNPPVLDGADQNFNPTWTHVQGNIYKTAYSWYKPQLTDSQYMSYFGGMYDYTVALQVYEDGELLRGYRNLNDPDYTLGVAGAYRTLAELDPANDNGDLPPAYVKHDLRIPGRFLYDQGAGELYVWSADEDNPNNHNYSIPVIFRLVDVKANGFKLKNFVIKHAEGYSVVLNDVNDCMIEDNFFISNIYGIWPNSAENIIIRRNFMQNKGFWERYWYYDTKSTVLWSYAIDLEGGTANRNTEIYENVISGNYIAIRAKAVDSKIHDNIISKGMSVLINPTEYHEAETYDLEIYHNIIHHGDYDAIGVSNFGTGPIWIYRNLFYRNLDLNRDGGSTASTGSDGVSYFYHNIHAFSRWINNHPYALPSHKNTIYRNNIFYLKYLTQSEMYWSYQGKNPANGWDYFPFDNGPDADYNLYWEVDGSDDPTYGISYFGTTSSARRYSNGEFGLMQSETGLEPNGSESDPLFVNKAEFETLDVSTINYDQFSNMDYRNVIGNYQSLFNQHFNQIFNEFVLQSGSPALNAGEVLPSSWPDTITIGDGQPDIGAFEYGNSSILYGDVSENGTISATDAAMCARYAVGLITLTAVGLITLTANQIIAADVSDNGTVSATDAAWIARKAVDPTIVFPVEVGG
jgi:hypothetical protein